MRKQEGGVMIALSVVSLLQQVVELRACALRFSLGREGHGHVDRSGLGGGVLGGGRLRHHDRCVMRRMHMAHNRLEFGEPPEHAT